jgi:FkbM family methyltransferase
MMKALAKRLIGTTASVLSRTPAGRYLYEVMIDSAMGQQRIVRHGELQMKFAVPNRLNHYRVTTFATKEPETLTWIEGIPPGSILWDVGANIGLYSVFAAKARDCRVYAFEPSVFNLELLARNVFANSVQDRVTLVPLALSDSVTASTFRLTTTAWGGALSTFSQRFDHHGAMLRETFEYRTIGVSMSDAVSLLGIPAPSFLKIDVDGLEHFILRGGRSVLESVESVLIEINDHFSAQSEESVRCLTEAGLVLRRKCDIGSEGLYNQWWTRSRPHGLGDRDV